MSWAELSHLDWRAPWAWLLALTPVLLYLLLRLRKPQWRRYADPALLAWAIRTERHLPQRKSHGLAEIAFWVLLACALAGPRLPLETLDPSTQHTKHDMDVMLVLDVSASMQATDVSPSRLSRAKFKIQDLLLRLQGERLGLIAYAGEPGLLVPLTYDLPAVQGVLDMVDEKLFEERGSHVAAALQLAQKQFIDKTRSRAILLLSDADASSLSGESGNAVVQAVQALKHSGIQFYVLSLASAGGTGLLREDGDPLEQHGVPVISRPDLDGYRTLAQLTGGKLAPVSDGADDLNALYTRGILGLPTARNPHDKTLRWRELYAYPLAAAWLILLLTTLHFRPRTAAAAAVLAASTTAQADDAGWREAHTAYRQGQYLVAQHVYHRLDGYHARMGEGAAAYRRKDYAHAVQQFNQALFLASRPDERADALFNLGNSLFYAGNRLAAADAFDGVLRYRPQDKRAKENLARVRGKLVLRNTNPAPPSGIPGRRGRGLGEGEANEDTPLDMTPDKDENRPLMGLTVDAAETAKLSGSLLGDPKLRKDAARKAALKKLDLLVDKRAITLKQLIQQDATRDIPAGLPPW